MRRMSATAVQDRNGKATEYLQLLRSLSFEMEKAMQAIAGNALPDLEESVASQQVLSARLLVLAELGWAPWDWHKAGSRCLAQQHSRNPSLSTIFLAPA